MAILAGCSVLNINNWVANDPLWNPDVFGPGAGYYPGIYMETTGPRYLLGYGHSAPSDAQNADAIIQAFGSSYLTDSSNPLWAWAQANNNSNGWNAVAIERGVRYGYFRRVTILGIPIPNYIWTEIPKADW